MTTDKPYVLAVRSNHALRFLEEWTLVQSDPTTMICELPPEAWQPLSAGEGAKGQRFYDWAWIPLGYQTAEGFSRRLLARRGLRDPQTIAYYFAYARAGTTLAELAASAGLHWTIEECVLRAKEDLGLDHCEARSWHGWAPSYEPPDGRCRLSGPDQRQSAPRGIREKNETSPGHQIAAT